MSNQKRHIFHFVHCFVNFYGQKNSQHLHYIWLMVEIKTNKMKKGIRDLFESTVENLQKTNSCVKNQMITEKKKMKHSKINAKKTENINIAKVFATWSSFALIMWPFGVCLCAELACSYEICTEQFFINAIEWKQHEKEEEKKNVAGYIKWKFTKMCTRCDGGELYKCCRLGSSARVSTYLHCTYITLINDLQDAYKANVENLSHTKCHIHRLGKILYFFSPISEHICVFSNQIFTNERLLPDILCEYGTISRSCYTSAGIFSIRCVILKTFIFFKSKCPRPRYCLLSFIIHFRHWIQIDACGGGIVFQCAFHIFCALSALSSIFLLYERTAVCSRISFAVNHLATLHRRLIG